MNAYFFFRFFRGGLVSQDGAYFGPLKNSEEYVAKSLPALVTNLKEDHPGVRDYTIAVLRERLAATQTSLTHASDNFYKNLWENGEFLQFSTAVLRSSTTVLRTGYMGEILAICLLPFFCCLSIGWSAEMLGTDRTAVFFFNVFLHDSACWSLPLFRVVAGYCCSP